MSECRGDGSWGLGPTVADNGSSAMLPHAQSTAAAAVNANAFEVFTIGSVTNDDH
jgi:hypothetical protein